MAAGETLTICAGSMITAADGVSLTVAGTLQIQGTAASPVKLVGATDAAGAWTGLVLDAGGAGHRDLPRDSRRRHRDRGAPGLDVRFDHLVIDTSSTMLVLSSNGTIAHGTLRGLGDSQSGIAGADQQRSPQITNTSVTQGLFGGVDMIVVGGGHSAPLFDHVEVADSHCAFHFDESTGATITNSFIHHNAYGFMVIESAGRPLQSQQLGRQRDQHRHLRGRHRRRGRGQLLRGRAVRRRTCSRCGDRDDAARAVHHRRRTAVRSFGPDGLRPRSVASDGGAGLTPSP